ncbi:MAG: hypothetical protein COA78_21835 [Blastopirellula sp.]|nr:MAG: hypothetical protein COA78_21835 [Blastopirellula sp.]
MNFSKPKLFVALIYLFPILLGCDSGPTQDAMMAKAKAKAEAMKIIKAEEEAARSQSPELKVTQASQLPVETPNRIIQKNVVMEPKNPDTQPSYKANRPSSYEKIHPPAIVHELAGKPGNSPPASPLDQTAIRARSIQNLEAISLALSAYIQKNRQLPLPAIYDPSGEPLLSWRVALLPYLGHAELYEKFDLKQPWDSAVNKQWLSEIPAIYQSPNRFDEKTNFLVPMSSGTGFQGRRPVLTKRIEDGLANTVILVEVDDSQAVFWTAPQEYTLKMDAPQQGLFSLREDGLFVCLGDGSLRLIPNGQSDKNVLAMFTIDKGDLVNIEHILPTKEVRAESNAVELITPLPVNSVASTTNSQVVTKNTSGNLGAGFNNRPTAAVGMQSSVRIPMNRLPVPDKIHTYQANQNFKDIFEKEYNAARTPQQKDQLSQKLFNEIENVREHPASLYVLLNITIQVSAQGGNLDVALKSIAEMTYIFDVDHRKLQLDTMQKLAQSINGSRAIKFADKSLEMSEISFQDSDYTMAVSYANMAMVAAKKSRETRKSIVYAQQVRKTNSALELHREAEKAIQKLENDPNNQSAKLLAGQYLCFLGNDWSNGLAILADAENGKLAGIAKQELTMPSNAMEQATLGDAWWDYAESANPGYQDFIRQHAIQWYKKALPTLQGGFQRVLIKRRIEGMKTES